MEAPRQPRLLDQVRERCRVNNYSLRTEQTYVQWIRRFILFHGKRHHRAMGAPEVEVLAMRIDTHVLNRGEQGVRSPLDRG